MVLLLLFIAHWVNKMKFNKYLKPEQRRIIAEEWSDEQREFLIKNTNEMFEQCNCVSYKEYQAIYNKLAQVLLGNAQ